MPVPVATVPAKTATVYEPEPWDRYAWRDIERTKTGLLLLLLGAVLGWIPYVNIVAALLTLVGVILVILGRQAFGEVHARNVWISFALFVVGVIAVFIVAFSFGFSVANAILRGDQAGIERAFSGFIFWGFVFGIVLGLASVLFTYALQDATGRYALWVGFVLGFALSLMVMILLLPEMTRAFQDAFASGTYNPVPIQNLQARVQLLQMLQAIPSMLYSVAYYLARSRIERGEIPKRRLRAVFTPAAAP